MKYEVRMSPKALKQLKKLDKKHSKRLIIKIYELADNPIPRTTQKLVAKRGYRIRVGVYRILYEVNKNELIVHIIEVGHRKNIYNR